jgi:PelA/Pel-15E family pectate lyase
MRRHTQILAAVVLAAVLLAAPFAWSADPSKQDVLAATKKATAYMVDEVSCNGGYLWTYSADLTRRWGEAPARESQIWVQGGTPAMGHCFLDLYETTGDVFYLESAKKAANALIYGQHPLGGWHYFIDFDITGLAQWYEDVFSNFKWGMEEYRHYYGNCTYDDDSTTGTARYLLRLYLITLDPAYREPLLKALDFILMSQYPNGAWPQRYPLRYEFAHDGLPDYTSLYTFNDECITGNIEFLFEAYEKLGDERYLKASRRGMEFLIISQGPKDQPAWADQHGFDLAPAWARTHEPAGFMIRYTSANIRALQRYYLMTGDRRYLDPIQPALDWFRRSALETLSDGRLKLSGRYEVGTNLPLYNLRTDKVNELGHGLWRQSNEPDDHVGHPTLDIAAMQRDFDRIAALSPDEALAEHARQKDRVRTPRTVKGSDVAELIDALDDRGAWVEDIVVFDMDVNNPSPPGVKFDNYNPEVDDDHASIPIKAISTSSFRNHMQVIQDYLKGLEK